MSVNLSPRQLQHPDLIPEVRRALMDNAVDPRWLKLELTETALMEDPPKAREQLIALRELGIGWSLDDFGTGYSSLAYLHQFPFQILKIDRSFTKSLSAPTGAPRIVRTILALARALDLECVAEGIERDHDVAFLTNLGCRFGQGNLFSPPVPAEVAAALLQRGQLP